jgi:hypothetical protein
MSDPVLHCAQPNGEPCPEWFRRHCSCLKESRREEILDETFNRTGGGDPGGNGDLR